MTEPVLHVVNPALDRPPTAKAIREARQIELARPKEQPLGMDPAAGRALWAQIHGLALSMPGEAFLAWLADLPAMMPCGLCRRHWAELTAAKPPAGDLFAWTVDRHNDVNRRLGKVELGLDEARVRWS